MRVRFPILSLVICVFCAGALAGLARRVVAAQITFVQTPQIRNQKRNQNGLPPEKKRSLSRYGPEDVFPESNKQEDNRARESRPQSSSQTRARSRSAFVQNRSEAMGATHPGTPSLTPAQMDAGAPGLPIRPSQHAIVTPTPRVIVAAIEQQLRQPPHDLQSIFPWLNYKWAVLVLSSLALIVSAALIYVLIKLREKIREGSGG